MNKVLEIHLPEYKKGKKPDSLSIGAKLDKLLYQNFQGKNIVVRCVGLQDHPNKSLDELAKEIIELGTDKYNKEQHVLAEALIPEQHRANSFYGEEMKIKYPEGDMHLVIDDFYHGALGDRGYSIRIDLIMIYDRSKLKMLEDIYEGHTKSDIFVFNDPSNKKAALLSLIKVL